MSDYSLPYAGHDLSGHVALVTGATSGLGVRFAKVLAQAGAKVAIAGRRIDRLESVKAEIEAMGGSCAAIRVDMRDPDDIVALVERAEAELGRVDILINNAGVADAKLATKIDIDLIDTVLDVNLRGPFILAREVAKRLIEAKAQGRIVNISSISAFNYLGAGASLYSTSKAAIARMSEVLAVEWGAYGINVNAIAPGFFKSEMSDGMVERVGDISGRFPRKRVCDPALLDSTILFLCSDASEAVTGTVIKVDDAQFGR